MPQGYENVNLGTGANTKTGDPARVAFGKINGALAYLYSLIEMLQNEEFAGLLTTDVVNNLESDLVNYPLSAAQGKTLKGLFDQLPTKLSEFENDLEIDHSIAVSNYNGNEQYSTDNLKFSKEFNFNTEEKKVLLNDEYLRLLSNRNNEIEVFIPTNITENYVSEDKIITLGKLFEVDYSVYRLNTWYRSAPSNGNISAGSKAPIKLTQEFYLEFTDSTINLSDSSFNNEISLFEVEISSEFIEDKESSLINKNIDILMTDGSTGSGDNISRFSTLFVTKKTYDYLGNVTGSVANTFRAQTSDYSGSSSLGNVLFSDYDFNLRMRLKIEFADGNNEEGLNDSFSTIMIYQALINEKI